MNADEFREQLRLGDYEIISRDIEPHHALGQHHHPWDVWGMVTEGSFTIEPAGSISHTYHKGEIFSLHAMVEHTEQAGPKGASILVGRRMPEPTS